MSCILRVKDELKRALVKIKSAILPTCAIGAAYAVMFLFGVTCPIKWLTGVSCPGCGMTRACAAALHLDFAKAFEFHPLWVVLLPFSVVLFFLFIRGKTKAVRTVTAVGVLLMITVYIIRLFGNSTIAVFAPQEGAVYISIQKILNFINIM